MKFRTLLYILVFLMVVVGTGYLYLLLKLKKQPPVAHYFARTALLVEHHSATPLGSDIPFRPLMDLHGWKPLAPDSLIGGIVSNSADCWVSHHYYGRGVWHQLIICAGAPPIAGVLNRFSAEQGWRQRRYQYAGRTIYVVQRGNTRWAFARDHGYLLWGSGGQILEEAFKAFDDTAYRAPVPALEPAQGWIQWDKVLMLAREHYPALRPLLTPTGAAGVYRIRRRGGQWEGYGRIAFPRRLRRSPALMQVPAGCIPYDAPLLIVNPADKIRHYAVPPGLDSLMNNVPGVWVGMVSEDLTRSVMYYPSYDSVTWEEQIAGQPSWRIDRPSQLPPSFRRMIVGDDTVYVGWWAGCLVMGREAALLGRIDRHIRFGNVLSRDPTFLYWQALLPDSFHVMMYFNPRTTDGEKQKPRLWSAVGTYFLVEPTDSNGRHIAFHAWHSLPRQAARRAGRRLAWEFTTDSPITDPLVRLYNYRTQRPEIGVVSGTTLTVLSSRGQLQWKRDLGGQLIAPPLRVDYYRNRKIQHLLLTPRKVFLVDRLGRNVAQYPIPLPEPARPGWRYIPQSSFFGKRAYVVPTRKGLRAYYLTGRPIPRWAPLRLSRPFMPPLRYFSLRGIRRVFAADSAGRFYFISPQGKITFQGETPHPPATGWQIHLGRTPAASYAYCIDTTGAVVEVSFARKIQRRPLFTPQAPMFLMKPPHSLSTAGIAHLVINGKTLLAFSKKWERRWAVPLDTTALAPPRVFSRQGKQLIGIWLADHAYCFVTPTGVVKMQRFTTTAPPVGVTDPAGRFLLVCPQGPTVRAFVLSPDLWESE